MSKQIKKREVFYISGYDPRGARHYYALYKEHLLKQNRLNGLNATISKRQTNSGESFWEITAHDKGTDVQTKYNFLSWTDIIVENWSKSITDMVNNFNYSVSAYIFTGLIFKYAKLSIKQMMAGLYPALYTLFLFAFMLFAGYETQKLLASLVPLYISMPVAFVAMYLVLNLGVKLGKSLAVFWLFNIYTLSVKWSKGKLPKLEKKIDAFVDEVFKVMQNADKNGVNEVLIVGHSVGTMLSVPLVARVLRKCEQEGIDGSILKLLTLGGTIPLISIQKEAQSYRDDLQYLALKEGFVWVDYTSKIDGTCFPMLDPILSAGLTREQGKGPIILSSRFHTLYTKENYKKLRYKWFDVHFWYIMSSDLPGAYDYFKITAGAEPLEQTLTRKI